MSFWLIAYVLYMFCALILIPVLSYLLYFCYKAERYVEVSTPTGRKVFR